MKGVPRVLARVSRHFLTIGVVRLQRVVPSFLFYAFDSSLIYAESKLRHEYVDLKRLTI